MKQNIKNKRRGKEEKKGSQDERKGGTRNADEGQEMDDLRIRLDRIRAQVSRDLRFKLNTMKVGRTKMHHKETSEKQTGLQRSIDALIRTCKHQSIKTSKTDIKATKPHNRKKARTSGGEHLGDNLNKDTPTLPRRGNKGKKGVLQPVRSHYPIVTAPYYGQLAPQVLQMPHMHAPHMTTLQAPMTFPHQHQHVMMPQQPLYYY